MKQLLTIILLAILVGCASVPELTPKETEQITVRCARNEGCMIAATEKLIAIKIIELEEAREDRRLVKRDELIIFLNACDASPVLVLVEVGRGAGWSKLPTEREQRKALKKYGYKFTHGNVGKRAMRSEYKCLNPRDLFRRLRMAEMTSIIDSYVPTKIENPIFILEEKL